MITDSLRLTSSMVLHAPPHSPQAALDLSNESGGVLRRSKTVWKVSHISVQLENAQIHLYGETRKPMAASGGFADSDESFFIGLSRLNYVRESKANKVSLDRGFSILKNLFS
jgi:hypothetical protein